MSDVSSANGIIQAFSDPNGLTREECEMTGHQEGWTTGQCELLVSVLGRGPGGEVTSEERDRLLSAGFHGEFVDLIRGEDGFEALRGRVEALGQFAERTSEPRSSRLSVIAEFRRIFSPIRPNAQLIGAALAPIASPHLAAIATRDGDHHLRYEALEVICTNPALRSLEVFHQALLDSDIAIRALSVSGLGAMTGPSVVSELAMYLRDSEPRVRSAAARALGAQGQGALAVLPDLIDRVLSDGSPDVRVRAVAALGSIGERGGEVVACLHWAVTDTDAQVRQRAISAMTRLPPLEETDLHMFREALHDPDSGVRETAAWALRISIP